MAELKTIELYRVVTVVHKLRLSIGEREGVSFWWFAWGGNPDQTLCRQGTPYAELMVGGTPHDPYAQSAIDECFTLDEATALKAYCDRVHGHEGVTRIEPVRWGNGFPEGIMPFGGIPVGGDDCNFDLFEDDGYDLPFKVSGYFDRRDGKAAA